MGKLRYALIGCGRIAPTHIRAAGCWQEDLELAAVCDILPQAMEELCEKFSLDAVKRYTDHRELLKKERLDFIAVATISGEHARIALDCIEAGVNVLVEKPIALSLTDADRLIAAAKAKGVVLGACHQNRFNKAVQQLREALDGGRFGRLFHGDIKIRWSRGSEYFSQADWRGTWAQDGGALMNQCIHGIDLLRWSMGDEVEEVFAYTDRQNHDYIEAEDIGTALVKFKNGSYGVIEGTTNIFRDDLEEILSVFGEKGTVKIAGSSANLLETWDFADSRAGDDTVFERAKENPSNVYGFGHASVYEDIIRSIRTGVKPYVDGEAGKRALELVLAVYRSAATHAPVKLPMDSCSTLEFSGRFGPAADR